MSDHPVKRRKKLIEVAIPLEAINAASAKEKSIRHGHPSTLHLWWARRPLAAARAVIFCQMVDDPSAVPEEFSTEEAQENERLRLFALISELVTWENTTNEQVLGRAREEIKRSWERACADNADHPEAEELFNPKKLPGFHDPFAGGGALPLEAQRLGLESYASDLNPVAVLINKAMIEIPPKFAGMPPVNPEARNKKELIQRQWMGAEGLAADLIYYGERIYQAAKWKTEKQYSKILISEKIISNPKNPRPDLAELRGHYVEPIAWIWSRTARSPNPSFSGVTPLLSSFLLSKKKGSEAYVQPEVVDGLLQYWVRHGSPTDPKSAERGTKLGGSHSSFRCLLSGDPISFKYLREEGKEGRLGQDLIAIIVKHAGKRIYLSPSDAELIPVPINEISWLPEQEICHWPGCTNVVVYGLTAFKDQFTNRQLFVLNAFAEAAKQMRAEIEHDINEFDFADDIKHDYLKSLYLLASLAISKETIFLTTQSRWRVGENKTAPGFGRQALPMLWDFAEINPFSGAGGDFYGVIKGIAKSLLNGPISPLPGAALQLDAASSHSINNSVVSTDPPYYDNIPYADLSDYFYGWLRMLLAADYPDLLGTISTPKSEELVATPSRHSSKVEAESFFLRGMQRAMLQIANHVHPLFPVTIYYAYKQSEISKEGAVSSTGWQSFLQALCDSNLQLNGTWPLRTENSTRLRGQSANALASSIVLVCYRRSETAKTLSRSEFRRDIRHAIPKALSELEKANVAPVDIPQAAIGPGMAVFSSAKAVVNPDDSFMSVKDALIEINSALDEYLSQDEGELDPDSRFALTFFEGYGYEERPYGDAEGLAVARNISVEGVSSAGILSAIGGRVQLLRREQLEDDWDPSQDDRLCVWEATQHLIRSLDSGGEASAAALLAQLKNLPGHGELAANCRALAYRLYNHCEKTKQTEEARAYNGLVIAWPELQRLATSQASASAVQTSLI
ncbi:MAG: Uncharacterised protein [Prochlorococcus marinus str. MIT 9215]|nr:MAG: Uncharacterised protein [Prochlorococcus marinus str. MIT 9215]